MQSKIMKKLLLIYILITSMLIAQNACKTCSEFSKSKEWSSFIECVTNKSLSGKWSFSRKS